MPLLIRPSGDLEEKLDHFSKKMGQSKNSIVSEALSDYFAKHSASQVLLEQEVKESAFDRMLQAREQDPKRYQEATEVLDWIQRRLLWTATENPSGKIREALYGINEVESFIYQEGSDDSLLLVVNHLSNPPPRGTARYLRYLIPFQDWKNNMRIVSHEPNY